MAFLTKSMTELCSRITTKQEASAGHAHENAPSHCSTGVFLGNMLNVFQALIAVGLQQGPAAQFQQQLQETAV
jgi:hypothetical protein